MTGYPGVASYMNYFVLASITVTVMYVFYLILLYLKSTALITSGTKDEFKEDSI